METRGRCNHCDERRLYGALLGSRRERGGERSAGTYRKRKERGGKERSVVVNNEKQEEKELAKKNPSNFSSDQSSLMHVPPGTAIGKGGALTVKNKGNRRGRRVSTGRRTSEGTVLPFVRPLPTPAENEP